MPGKRGSYRDGFLIKNLSLDILAHLIIIRYKVYQGRVSKKFRSKWRSSFGWPWGTHLCLLKDSPGAQGLDREWKEKTLDLHIKHFGLKLFSFQFKISKLCLICSSTGTVIAFWKESDFPSVFPHWWLAVCAILRTGLRGRPQVTGCKPGCPSAGLTRNTEEEKCPFGSSEMNSGNCLSFKVPQMIPGQLSLTAILLDFKVMGQACSS